VLDIEVAGGTVTVRGEVPDLHQHWRCVECCRHVAGVRAVVDELVVASDDAMQA
jgi:osmotically-inducible protein OsmY